MRAVSSGENQKEFCWRPYMRAKDERSIKGGHTQGEKRT
jgi:hypothetical protein